MNRATVFSKKKCFLWHKWELITGNPKTNYFICKKCGSRKVEQYLEGYQPIDIEFLIKANDEAKIGDEK